MTSAAELEAVLQRQPDDATWAVYADLLQAKGDPRGELIALDLQLDREGRPPELVKRRNAALRSWLGSGTIDGRSWNLARFKFTLFDDTGSSFEGNDNLTYLQALLRSPAAEGLAGLRVQSANLAPRHFEFLTSRTFPWLRHLELDQFWSHRPPNDWWKQLWACAPNLVALTVNRHSEFQPLSLSHPTLETLTVIDEAVSLYNASLPKLRTVRFAGRVSLSAVFRRDPPVERIEFLGRDWVLFDDNHFTEAGRARVTSVWLDARFDQGEHRLRRVLGAFPNARIEYAFAAKPSMLSERVVSTSPGP